MPFLLAEILNFQGSTHRIGVGSFSNIVYTEQSTDIHKKNRDVQKAGMQQTHL